MHCTWAWLYLCASLCAGDDKPYRTLDTLPKLTKQHDAIRSCQTISHNMYLHEVMFNRIVSDMFLENLVPGGYVLDAGAHTGENACLYASLAPDRRVLAIEPIEANVAAIQNRGLSNIDVMNAVLASFTGKISLDAAALRNTTGQQLQGTSRASVNAKSTVRLPAHRVDDLFAQRKLGFVHLDVEGEEINVLKGAMHTLRRDRPIFTAELHVHLNQSQSSALIALGRAVRHIAYVVENDSGGTCGARMDCRNIIFVPSESKNVHTALEKYVQRGHLVKVDQNTILSLAHPCCIPGGACCANGNEPLSKPHRCCVARTVNPFEKQGGAVVNDRGG